MGRRYNTPMPSQRRHIREPRASGELPPRWRGWLACAAILAALPACPGAAKVDKKKSLTRVELAKDQVGKGQLEGAEVEAQKALRYDPKNEEAHYLLGMVDYLRAVRTFQLLEVEDCLTGVDAEALRAEFDQHLLNADKHFAKAVELAPDFGEPLANRGSVATQLGDYGAAIEYLTRALTMPSRLQNVGLTRANLGWAYFQNGDYVSAAKHLRQALQFQPRMCLGSYRLGRVYFARKEWEKAREKFQEVITHECPIQEAFLFWMKTVKELGTEDINPEHVEQCVAPAPKSCVAAQCRSIVH
jgi:Tfp pilus assembly protein PilF